MLICENCGKEIKLKPRTLKDRKRLGKPMLCKHCIRSLSSKEMWKNISYEDKMNIMNKVYKGRDQYFENMTEDELIIRKESIKNGLKNMDEESKKKRSEKLSKSIKEFWDNLSKEEYEYQCELRKIGWANMDPEKREEWHNKIIELSKDENHRELLRQKQYEHYKKHPERRLKLSIDGLNQWNNKTDKEKEEFSIMMKNWWSNLSDASYISLQEKISKGIERSKNKKFISNKLENDLAKIFDKESIKYIRQYATIEMYDTNTEWYKEYSKHSKFLGYRKNWDFYLPDYDIYIDIDGPYHTFAGSYNKPIPDTIKYLAKKEFKGYSSIQNYYDTRRLLINKRIIILGYDKELYDNSTSSNKKIELNINEIIMLLTLLKSLK